MAFHNYENVAIRAEYNGVWENALKHYESTMDPTADPPYMGDALLCTEFGAVPRNPPGQEGFISAEWDSVDAYKMPAIYWAYWNRTPYEIVNPDDNNKPISAADMGIVWDPKLPLDDSNVWQGGLTALTRPYPMFIAGRPDGPGDGWELSYPTPDKPAFSLRYGRRSATNEVTQIYVPPGWDLTLDSVDVMGGIVSAIDRAVPGDDQSGQLVWITNNQDAYKVSVTITSA